MNVRIAVETFSESVASSIQFLMDQKVPQFQGAKPTIDSIRRMNTLFDIFNSKNPKHEDIFKRALSTDNKRIIFDFCQDTIKFFKTLKVEEIFYKKDTKESEEEAEKGKKREKRESDRTR